MNSYRRLVLALGVNLVIVSLASALFLAKRSWAGSKVTVQAVQTKEKIALHAAGRGNPWINLRDGYELSTDYAAKAALQQVLEQDAARPLTLASGDFDEDGVPDLVSGYLSPSGGIITLHRGNIDSLYPNTPEAMHRKARGEFSDSPFLSPARAFEVPEGPELIGAGDFDNDGHWDVVTAAWGSDSLYLLSGDGRGGLGPAQQIKLPGQVTTLVTGEINRNDGLIDVVVGIASAEGPKLMIFESPDGSLRGRPEVLPLPAEATALALGHLDDDYPVDLVIAAGQKLLIVHGRDRKLSLDEIRQAEVPQAAISERAFPFALTSIALGDFIGDHQSDIALLSDDGDVCLLEGSEHEKVQAWKLISSTQPLNLSQDRGDSWSSASGSCMVRVKVSTSPKDDLLVVDRAKHQLHILMSNSGSRSQVSSLGPLSADSPFVTFDVEGDPVAVLPMRLNVDALSDLVILKQGRNALAVTLTAPLATFTVNSTVDGADCDPKDGVCSTGTINPNTGQCVLTGICTLRAAIQQANSSSGADAISFDVSSISPSGYLSPIAGPVTIDGTAPSGGRVEISGGGLIIADSASNVVVRRLVINRAAGSGIYIAGAIGCIIEDNFIGTDVTGTVALGNRDGVSISDTYDSNIIGGTTPEARNVISGNNGFGISINNTGTTREEIFVQGNFIGTDKNGTAALGNRRSGVDISGPGPGVTIGGTTAGARNIISGNSLGVGLSRGFPLLTFGIRVQGNFIGTDKTGRNAIGNPGGGVSIGEASGNTVGGAAIGARNVISGNNGPGIVISGPGNGNGNAATSNLVQGNFIGTDIDVNDKNPLGNIGGIQIREAAGTTIGGIANGAGNVIAFNNGPGVFVFFPAAGNAILSNSIYSNNGLGIELRRSTLNQKHPILVSGYTGYISNSIITGRIFDKPRTTFLIQFFSSPGCPSSGIGEGKNYLGSINKTTDDSGMAKFEYMTASAAGQIISATATDPANNTSQFSKCFSSRVTRVEPVQVVFTPPNLPDQTSILVAGKPTAFFVEIEAERPDLIANGIVEVTVDFDGEQWKAEARKDDFRPRSGKYLAVVIINNRYFPKIENGRERFLKMFVSVDPGDQIEKEVRIMAVPPLKVLFVEVPDPPDNCPDICPGKCYEPSKDWIGGRDKNITILKRFYPVPSIDVRTDINFITGDCNKKGGMSIDLTRLEQERPKWPEADFVVGIVPGGNIEKKYKDGYFWYHTDEVKGGYQEGGKAVLVSEVSPKAAAHEIGHLYRLLEEAGNYLKTGYEWPKGYSIEEQRCIGDKSWCEPETELRVCMMDTATPCKEILPDGKCKNDEFYDHWIEYAHYIDLIYEIGKFPRPSRALPPPRPPIRRVAPRYMLPPTN